jgi:hypothetical protein
MKKPVVLVGDKLLEVKRLIDERQDIAACSTVCVDKGIQTDDICVDHVSHVSVHMASPVDGRVRPNRSNRALEF